MRTVAERLEGSTDNIKKTIDIVWSAYRSVLSKEGYLAYVSGPISSGKLLYQALADEGTTYDELKTKNPKLLYEEIIKPNIESGKSIAKNIAACSDEPVVAPTIFEAHGQRWSQDEYMGMWLQMIRENVGRMIMSDGWQYSNGGAEEFLFAMQLAYGLLDRCDITVENQTGEPLALSQGVGLIGEALIDLHDMGQQSETLANVLVYLFNMPKIWMAVSRDFEVQYNRRITDEINDHNALYRHRSELIPLLKAEYGIKDDLQWHLHCEKGLLKKMAMPEGLLLAPEEIQ